MSQCEFLTVTIPASHNQYLFSDINISLGSKAIHLREGMLGSLIIALLQIFDESILTLRTPVEI